MFPFLKLSALFSLNCVWLMCTQCCAHERAPIIPKLSPHDHQQTERGEGFTPRSLCHCTTGSCGCGAQYHTRDSSSCAAVIRCRLFAYICRKYLTLMAEEDTDAVNPHSESKGTPLNRSYGKKFIASGMFISSLMHLDCVIMRFGSLKSTRQICDWCCSSDGGR